MNFLLIWFFNVINCYSQFQEFSQDDLDFVCSELKERLSHTIYQLFEDAEKAKDSRDISSSRTQAEL